MLNKLRFLFTIALFLSLVQSLQAQTINLTSQQVMWIDGNNCNSQGPRGAWMSFTIHNTTAGTLTNVRAEFDGFTGTNANLFIEPNDSVRTFSSIPAGQKVPVYFYIDYSNVCVAGTPFDGKTANYTLTVTSNENGTVTRNASISTNTLLSASAAGQAVSSTLNASSIYVGQTFTQSVVYEFGNNNDLFFQPNCNASFPEYALRLVGSRITAGTSGVSNLVGYKDSLHFPSGQTSSSNNQVTVQYTWYVKGISPSVTIFPWAAAKSGQRYKYSGLARSQIIPASTQALSITKSANPSFLTTASSDGGFGAGKVRWTITLHNPTNQAIAASSIRDSIVPCMSISNPAVSGSQITSSNSQSIPSVSSNGWQIWQGLSPSTTTNQQYEVPANSTLYLTYETDVTNCSTPSVQQNKAFASVEDITIGPATAYLSLGCNVPDLSYPLSSYCATGTISPTLVGTPGGTYSGTSGLSINSSTGEINLATSSPGVHTITYTVVDGPCTNTDTYTLTINAFPAAPAAIAGDTVLCLIGETSQLTNTIPSGNWISSNPAVATITSGGLLTAVSSGFTYITYKTETVCGVDSVYRRISVGQLPSPNFSINTISRCLSNNEFIFTPSSPSTHTLYEFRYGNGERDTTFGSDTSYSYPTAGTYEFVLMAYDIVSGCYNSDTASVAVLANPTGTLTVNQATQCIGGNSFVFQNNYTGNSGNISTSHYTIIGVWDTILFNAANLTYSFQNPGNYEVTLMVTSDSLCNTFSDTLDITVSANPAPSFSINDTAQCLSSNSFNFTNLSSAYSSSIWNFGDGNTSILNNPNHVYALSDTFTVKLIVSSAAGCSDSITKSVVIGEVGVPDFSYDLPLCASEYVFDNNSTGYYSSVLWKFGDGTTSNDVHPIKAFASTGTYQVKLIINGFGCSDSITKSLTYNGPLFPTAGFTYTVVDCNGTLEFTNTSVDAIEYIWDFGNGSVCTNFINNQLRSFGPGVHYVSLIAKGPGANCADTFTQVITVPPAPIAIFSETPIRCSRNVNFNNYSYFDSSWTWNFGDPSTGIDNTSTLENPSHVYSANGTYTVRLIASNGGCRDTIEQQVIVDDAGVMPDAVFTSTATGGSCINKIQFNNLSTSAATYVWKFHDGSSSTQTNPFKTYAVAGVYPVTLVAVSSSGCIDSATTNMTILQTKSGALASFYPDDSVKCFVDNSFIFYNTSQYFGEGWIPKYYWDFGDGTTDTLNTFVFGKEYDTAGVYLVRLVAVAANGCRDTAYQQVQVKPSSFARFYAGTECTMTARIQNLSTGSITHIWNFGEDSTMVEDNSSNLSYTYSTAGWKIITLIAVAANGCSDTATGPVFPFPGPKPTANFKYDTLSCGNAIKFTSTSWAGTEFIWDFGDGSPLDSTYDPIHAYAVAGTYQVRLIAFNGPHCVDTITLTVNAPAGVYTTIPEAKMRIDEFACENRILLVDRSEDATAWEWYRNDTLIGQQAQLWVINQPYGGNTYKLVAKNGICRDSVSQLFIMNPAPQADFQVIGNSCSKTVRFNSTSLYADSFFWDFGDVGSLTNTGNSAQTAHTYATNGTYYVRLIVKSLNGCADTIIKEIAVTGIINPVRASFNFNYVTCDCPNSNKVDFDNTSPGSGLNFLWLFGDGNTSTQHSPLKGYSDTGAFTVTLIATDGNGCSASASAQLYIRPSSKGPSAGFTTDNAIQCESGNLFNFYNQSVYLGTGWISNYYWYFGDGTFDTTHTSTYGKVYTAPGYYTVTLVAVAADGIRDTSTMLVTVAALPCTGLYAAAAMNSPYLFDSFKLRAAPGNATAIAKPVVEAKGSFVVYPNPGTGLFYVESPNMENRITELRVLDATGKLVHQANYQLAQQLNPSLSFSLDGNGNGLYVVWVKYENGSSSHQMISLIH
ncbi:MAG: PKD domain-containing protein [Bacteroidia bacterium]